MTAYDRRATRRPDAVVFADVELGLRVWKPKEKGAAWRYVYRDPASGERVSSRFYGTRSEVGREFDRLRKDLRAERTSEWRKLTFRWLAESYLAWPKHEWEPAVRRNQTQKVATLLDETKLGGQKSTLGKVVHSSTMLEDSLDALAATTRGRTGRPFAASSLGTYRDLMATIISWGQKRGHIPKELAPMKGVAVPTAAPGAKQPARIALRADDADGSSDAGLILPSEIPSRAGATLLGQVWADRSTGLVSGEVRALSVDLAATSGLRWGEQHSLRPRDVVWTGEVPYLRVERKLLIGADGSVIGFSLPKMGKSRIGLLSPHLHDRLRARCEEVERLYGPDGLLFPSPMDPTRPYEPDSFGTSMRNFARQADWPVDAHGLLLHTWHGLRHLACSWLLNEVGVAPITVSRSMGHASLVFTLNRYVGESDDAREVAGQVLVNYWASR